MRNIKLRVGTVQEWGKTGENNAAALVLDVTENLSLWPDGQPQAVYYRPDGTVYPLPCSLSGGTVEVPLTATETATAGRAQIEIQWIDEGVLAKSATYSGNIVQSLAEPGEEPPEPMQSWLDQLTGLAGDAAEAAEDAAVAQGLAEDARDEAQGYATGMTTAIEEALEPIAEELALKADKATTYTKTEADAAAGAAIVAAIAPVTSQLAEIIQIATQTNRINLFNPDTITDNTFVNPSTGAESANASYYATDYIPVTPGMTISFQNDATTAYYSRGYDGARFVCYFDQNKNKVAPGINATVSTFLVPDGVYFIRASLYRANKTALRRPSINTCGRITEFTPFGVAKAKPNDAPEIANPYQLYSIAGVPFTIYPRNITDASKDTHLVSLPSTHGTDVGDARNITDAEANTNLLTNFVLYSKTNGAAVRYGASKRVAVASSNSNGTFKVLQIGDSTTAGGQQVTQLLNRSAAEGEVTKIVLAGTLGTSPAFHEGRSGWALEECCTVADNNPFFNPATERFDFAYYASNNAITGLNAVIVSLGINDLYSLMDLIDDAVIDAKISETIGYCLEVVNSIKAYDSNIKIIVDTVIHGNADASKHIVQQTPWGYKRIVIKYNTALIEAMIPRGIVVAPTFLYVDPASDIADQVHPTADGYVKLGNVHFDILKSILT